MARIVVGVGGGIAAYKVPGLVRAFTEAGHHVDVIPTRAALEFVGVSTWEAVSHQPVRSTVFEAVDTVNHVRLGQEADLVVVAPATADLLARVTAGLADDLLTSTILTTTAPVYLAPAMHTEMWQNPATQTNVATLRARGVHVPDPATGRLTGQDSGLGRLAEIEDIAEDALRTMREHIAADAAGVSLAGRTAVVTAGGTREPLDPVRFLGNRSTGKQGVAVAQVLREAGADVTLIAANIEVAPPRGVTVIPVTSARELQEETSGHAERADVLVMTAAVADFRPREYLGHKIKKNVEDDSAPSIELVRNPDILHTLVSERRQRQAADGASSVSPELIVGFAAETGDQAGTVMEYGRAKLERKGADLLVVNEVSETKGFGAEENTVAVLAADGQDTEEFTGTKRHVAEFVVQAIAARLSS